MNPVSAWLQANGIVMPNRVDATQAVIAAGLVVAILALAVFAGRKFGAQLAEQWQRRVATDNDTMSRKIPAIVRHTTAALLLAVVLNAWSWPPLAALGIGIAVGAALAFAAFQLLRGLGIARWMAWMFGLVLFVAVVGHAAGGLDPIADVLERIGFDVGRRRFSLLSLVTMMVTVVALFAAIRLANRAIGHSIANARGLDPTQKLLAQKLVGIAVVIAAFFVGIDLLAIDLTTFAVFSGAFGLAIGFGLQKTVGNLIAGIILLMDRSIKPGDVIVVGGSVGWVNKIGVRAVSIITRDGKEHLIPNENLMTQEVENWSYSNRNVRVRIPVGVAYDCDLKHAQELMLRAATESPRVLDTPKPNVWLKAFGENAVEHEILAWINDPEGGVGNVRSDVLNRLWWLFKEHGIAIPYPQRDIHIRSFPDALAATPQHNAR